EHRDKVNGNLVEEVNSELRGDVERVETAVNEEGQLGCVGQKGDDGFCVIIEIVFFKQKTAYEISACLVG
ncbi:hypothetical protein, partial [Streptococcus suis]